MEEQHYACWCPPPIEPDHHKRESADSQDASEPSQRVDVCPLCCLPLHKLGDVHTGIHVPPMPPTSQTLDEPQEEMRSSVLTPQNDKEGEGTRSKTHTHAENVDDHGAKDRARLAMLNHIADHLQHVALLTLRVKTDQPDVSDVQTFPSSISASGCRSLTTTYDTDDELVFSNSSYAGEPDEQTIPRDDGFQSEAEQLRTSQKVEWDEKNRSARVSLENQDWSMLKSMVLSDKAARLKADA